MALTWVIWMAMLQTGDANLRPSEVASKMFERYSSASSVKGQIDLTIQVTGNIFKAKTEIQYERPNKVYLKQTNLADAAQLKLLSSDGKHFSYDVPDNLLTQAKRLVEPVHPPHRDPLSIADMYKAASSSLLDRSPALDIVISSLDDLRHLRSQWASIASRGMTEHRGRHAYWIVGDWRRSAADEPSGLYEMLVTPEGDLLRFVLHQQTMALEGGNYVPQQVVSTWDVDVRIGGPLDPALFRVVP